MGLRNLKTDLKSLRYSGDTLGGGTSNQPYIKVPIPDGFNNLQNSTSDFVLRGGMLAAKDSLTDVARLGKMFADTKSPNGLLFIAKQNLLSRLAVRTQAATGPLNEGIYTPLSTLAQAGLVAFGGHLNKQGLNPFDSTGAYSNNSNLYEVKITNQELLNPSINRLVTLNRIVYVDNSTINNYDFSKVSLNSGINVMTYPGGPGAPLGIGKTAIRYAKNLTVGNPNSNIYSKDGLFSNDTNVQTPKEINNSSELNNNRNNSWFAPNIQDFREVLRIKLKEKGPKFPITNQPWTTVLSNAPDYETNNLEIRTNIGGYAGLGPGDRQGKNLISYTSGSGIGPVDQLNALPIYRSKAVQQNSNEYPVNDLIKFRIASIDNNDPVFKTFMHFRAFINNFSDNYNGNWNPVTYLGRGEQFYTYSNFTRTISLGWTVAAQSKEELIPMYKKLNYLASNVAPDYTGNGYMTGNLVQLTIGGYLYEQVGFITSLTYDIPEDSPWEIGINDIGGSDSSVKELPHRINVSNFTFTPIHDFIPSKQNFGFGKGDEGKAVWDGNQRFIALANGVNSINTNYNSSTIIQQAPVKPLPVNVNIPAPTPI